MSESSDRTEVDDIGCIEAINDLYAYLDGELTDPEAVTKFEHHLEHCAACYSRIELETALGRLLRDGARDPAPPRLQKRLRKLIDDL
jgi:mycothiol system anti-sigma-R factor